jgi:hypothetical protein
MPATYGNTQSFLLLESKSLTLFSDAWKRARSPNEFEDLVRGERHLYGASAIRNMCIAGLRVFKNLQYSPITWLYLIILGTLCATYG